MRLFWKNSIPFELVPCFFWFSCCVFSCECAVDFRVDASFAGACARPVRSEIVWLNYWLSSGVRIRIKIGLEYSMILGFNQNEELSTPMRANCCVFIIAKALSLQQKTITTDSLCACEWASARVALQSTANAAQIALQCVSESIACLFAVLAHRNTRMRTSVHKTPAKARNKLYSLCALPSTCAYRFIHSAHMCSKLPMLRAGCSSQPCAHTTFAAKPYALDVPEP